MFSNYFKIAFRNLRKNKVYTTINVGGLAIGMAVAMLIGLWMYDELSFNKYHKNYDQIAQVMQQGENNGEVFTSGYMPIPLANALRTDFGSDFEHVVLSSWTSEHILAYGEKKFTKKGNFFSPDAPDMLSLKMLAGSSTGLQDPSAILLSNSVAEALFGSSDPIDKIVKLDNKDNLKVAGVYEDLPYNTQFRELNFIAPWDLYVSIQSEVKNVQERAEWTNNSWQILAQISPNTNFEAVSSKIKNITLKHVPEAAQSNVQLFLNPMSRWHLYADWDKTGKAGGRISSLWLFGIIGVFVLLLACINFMNLSTARSEKRSKEVGVRKAIGSARSQLVAQFFSESFLVVGLAFILSVALVQLFLPVFNGLADKQITIPWLNPVFWLSGIAFSLFTGFIAGLYPALYLSSFSAIKVLKGTFKIGKFAAIPRKALVVTQFTVSIALIVGTMVVYNQIQYAKNRPIGYDRNGLITVTMNTPELFGHYNVWRSELLNTGAVVEMSTSSTPTTNLNSQNNGFYWEGKDPNFKENFGTIAVTHDFGKTVGWKFKEGRDFSRDFATDSSGMVINATAARYMGLSDPVGKTMKWGNKSYQILGVIEDMVMNSPYEPVYQTVFVMDYDWAGVINIKLNPNQSASTSLAAIGAVFRERNPGSPFDYKFADEEYGKKFAAEERIGKLATFFAILAIFISCLGLFGLASFMAEQRTKEIGVRKVLGASVAGVTALLTKDFLKLVVVAIVIASPLAYFFMQRWLNDFEYRLEIQWWVFVLAGSAAVLVAFLTVSFQSIKAALMNPVKSLRSE